MRLCFGRRFAQVLLATALICAASTAFDVLARTSASERVAGWPAPANARQSSPGLGDSLDEAHQKSAGCVGCHNPMDSATMHNTGTVRLGCTDCHGGNAEIGLPAGVARASAEYAEVKKQAHPRPRFAENARSSANPVRTYTQWLKEDAEYIKFINPGDLRVAEQTCGGSGCHGAEVQRVRTSMMTHGAMLWGAALYNNGALPLKNPFFGESYGPDGKPQRLQTFPPPTGEETRTKGVLPYLEPIERWEVSQPGNVLRVFERGGERKPEVGIPQSRPTAGKARCETRRARLGYVVAYRPHRSRFAKKPPHCCDSGSIPRPRKRLEMEGGVCWPGRRARCVTILIVISPVRSSLRISARSFSAAKRTSRDPSSARSGSHRTVLWCDVAWNWPLNTCLRLMRL